MLKDIQILFGVQINGSKHVAEKWFSIEEYNKAIDKKAYLDVALKHMMEILRSELGKNDLI